MKPDLAQTQRPSRKVLIAGCGDLGLRIAALLLEDPQTEVWALRRQAPTTTGDTQTSAPLARLCWLQADLTQPETLTQIPPDVTHLVYAASADGRNEDAYRAIYLAGLQHIVAACHNPQLKRAIFISSTADYGDHGHDWVDETTVSAPPSFNGQIMLEAEAWLARESNIPSTVSLRLSGIYGPGRQYLTNRLRDGLVTAPAADQHWVNRIHISDAARAVVHVMSLTKADECYLVTDCQPLPMRVLYEAMAAMVGGPVPALGPAPASVGSKRLSNQRLRASGFTFDWPDSRLGHAALLQNDRILTGSTT